jgi:hypothetical protein
MQPIGPGSVAQTALGGVKRALSNFAESASEVTRQGAIGSQAAHSLSLSGQAPAAADSAPGAGLQQAMVDLRVAKYSAIANLRVLQTADSVSRELADLAAPRKG